MIPPCLRRIAPWHRTPGGPARQTKRRSRPAIEALESRTVLYSASGNLWPSPQLITLSFMPDGTMINGKASNLASTFNSKFGSGAWQVTIEKAAQTWAAQTNVNFAVVPDSGAANGSGSYQQGDPSFGDIRIGGYNFGSSTLAQAYMPPPVNNYSLAGDVTFNTGQAFGSTYDLYTVAVHEIGHALGLYHSGIASAEEYGSYNGSKTALTSDDVAGIESIYSGGGARGQDQYGSNSNAGQAYDITSLINTTTRTALVTGADLTTAGQTDYYKFTVPQGASTSFTVTASSKGLSLLSPKLTITDSSGSGYGTYSNSQGYGSAVTASVSNVTAGKVYILAVTGSESTVFGTGAYGIGLTVGTNAVPAVPVAGTTKHNGSPLSAGGGQAQKVNLESLVNTTTSGQQSLDFNSTQSVAMDGQGNYVVTWQSQNQDGGGWGIYAQRFDVNGQRLGGEFRVNTTTAGDQTNAAVAMDPTGDFVIAWSSNGQDGSGKGVYAQRYGPSGAAAGGEFRVNTYTNNDQTFPTLAIDSAGDFVVTWTSNGQDGSNNGIYAQRYSAAGATQGGEFRVNTTTSDIQSNSSVAMDSAGDSVVTWSSRTQDGGGYGVYAQRYNATGAAVGGEFRVNTYTNGDQAYSSAAMDKAGNFAIVWQSLNQNVTGLSIHAQRYNNLGAAQGNELLVDTAGTGTDLYPAVAMDSSGDLLVTWSNNPGTAGQVYGQQYTSNGPALGGQFLVNTTTGYNESYASAVMDNNGHVVSVWSGGNAADAAGVLMQQYTISFSGDSSDGYYAAGDPSDPQHDPAPVVAPTAVPAPSPARNPFTLPTRSASPDAHHVDLALRAFGETSRPTAAGSFRVVAPAHEAVPAPVSHREVTRHHSPAPRGPQAHRVRHTSSREGLNHAGHHAPRFF